MKKHIAIALGMAIAIAGGTATVSQAGIGLGLGTDINIGINADTSLDEQFNKVDSNSDGVISSEEAEASTELEANFATMDADDDAKLTQSEFKAGLKANVQAEGDSALDKTGDALSNAAVKTKTGIKAGANKTGELAGKAASKTKAGITAGAGAVGDAAATAQVNLSSELSNRFNSLDTNGDGVISNTEAKADVGIQTSFETADEDGNNQLTKAEFEAAADVAAETE